MNEAWSDCTEILHDDAWAVATDVSDELVDAWRGLIDRAIAEGWSAAAFRGAFDAATERT